MLPLWIRVLSAGIVLCPVLAHAETPLSLEEAVRASMASNERSLKAPLRTEIAEGQLDKARAAFLPSLGATATGTVQRPKDGGGRAFDNNTGLSLTQPLFNLSSFPLYSQARHQVEAERWGAAQDKRVLAFDTARTFLTVLTNEGLVDAAQQKLDRARASQKDAEARAKAQLASSNDVTLAQVATASASRDVTTANGNLLRSQIQLAFLIGRPVTGPLAAPDATLRAAENGAFRGEDVTLLAAGRRADVRSAEEKTASLRASAREPLYRLAPTLSASGQVKLVIDPLAPARSHEESAQLTLTWNLYDAGSRYADLRTRRAQAESAALDERALRRSIATDVGLALASLVSAREAFRVSKEGVEAAQRNTTEVQILYGQGLARALEVVDANGRRYDAEVSLATSKRSMQQAYLDLRAAVGLDPIEDGSSSPTSHQIDDNGRKP